ncbi:YceI family protein [Parvularcula sp. IMCC14364]|uniref:YceI family protein n=1 Tax=Parvularcula sp. IMCC14364 TaxID=3067902 RepID=UPI00274288EF|nr:YceI family protein [Parvularcula sp. IMCC14364]
MTLRFLNHVLLISVLMINASASAAMQQPEAPEEALPEPVQLYRLQPEDTHVGFTVRHMPFSTVTGSFDRFEAFFAFDERAPSVIDFLGVVDMTSFNPEREPPIDVTGPDWFALEQHPTGHFHGYTMQMTGEKTAIVSGDMTMKGITGEAEIEIVFPEASPFFEPYPDSFPFEARMVVDRTRFGMTRLQGIVRKDIVLTFSGNLQRQNVGLLTEPGFALPPVVDDFLADLEARP